MRGNQGTSLKTIRIVSVFGARAPVRMREENEHERNDGRRRGEMETGW